MEILLEQLYNTDISADKFHQRKVFIDDMSYQITGITQSGKSHLIKNYLLTLKKSSYLYIDCSDIRIDADELNQHLSTFCIENKVDTLVLDNYKPAINIVNVSQLLISSEIDYDIPYLNKIKLYPLDYEEFLAYEHKYDSTALNHFFQLGGYAHMHKLSVDERVSYIQRTLQYALEEMEFDILVLCAKMMAQKLSPFSIYERLKQNRKVSKDKLYKSYESLHLKGYIHQLGKFNHPKATKKIYLCDTSIRLALTFDRHFGRRFENMIYLELIKSNRETFYDDGVDFYIPEDDEIILGMPFTDERTLFKKIESMEAFIFTHQVRKITAVTMNREAKINHPFSKVEMVPFDIWALGD